MLINAVERAFKRESLFIVFEFRLLPGARLLLLPRSLLQWSELEILEIVRLCNSSSLLLKSGGKSFASSSCGDLVYLSTGRSKPLSVDSAIVGLFELEIDRSKV